jgi:chorismate mutase
LSQTDRLAEALAAQRATIDRLNHELLALLEARGRTVELIMRLKEDALRAVVDPKREQGMLAQLRAAAKGPYSDEQIERVFRCIFEISRELGERRRAESAGRDSGISR